MKTTRGVADASLRVETGPCRGQRYAVGEDEVLGRGEEATIVVDDPEVSRRHARIATGAEGRTIEDLGSRNGTTVEGTRITAPTPVRIGDAIGLGPHTRLVIETEGEPSAPGAWRRETLGRVSASVARELGGKLCAARVNLDYLCAVIDPDGRDAALASCLADLSAALGDSMNLLPQLCDLEEARPHRDRRVDLSRIVRDLAMSLERSSAATLTVASRVEPGLVVRGDGVELYHALLELATRCREAVAEGSRMFVGARKKPLSRFDRRRGRVIVTVRPVDPDGGAADDDEAAAAGEEPGWLEPVREVVALHGGRLAVIGAEGYRIDLPPGDDAPATAVTAPSAPSRIVEPDRGLGHPVLVVHHDPVVRRSIARILDRAGMEVTDVEPDVVTETLKGAAARPRVAVVEEAPSPGGGSVADEVAAFGRGVKLVVMAGTGGAPRLGSQRQVLRQPWTAESLLDAVDRALATR